MAQLLRLAEGAFTTFNGNKFQVGHVDAPYRVHEIGRQVLYVLASFAEPCDPERVLSGLKVSEDVRRGLEAFLKDLHREGVLTDEPKPQQPERDTKTTIFEVARTTEVHSDIARMYPQFRDAWRRVQQDSLSSLPIGLALWKACLHIVENAVPGAVVECGVWRGASMALAVMAFEHAGARERDLYLYDIFDWSWEAAVGSDGFLMSHAEAQAARAANAPAPSDQGWEERVVQRLVTLGHSPARIRTVRGRVQDTIPGVVPEQIAILRLDTDYYDSTLHELEHLYPRLARGGILLVDDYGRIEEATRAVDEYFSKQPKKMLLNRIDAQGCIGIKED